MRDDAYEGVPGVFDLVRAKARGLTEKQVYAEHARRAGERADRREGLKTASERSDAIASLREELKAVRDYGERGASAKSPALKHEYKRIQADEREHADSFKKQVKTASFMDVLRRGLHGAGAALKPLAKEPALLAAVAAPLVGVGVNEISKHRAAVRQAKAKAQNYRTMMELTPRLRIHDQQEIGRIYNTLHNINPVMGSDPLIAGAWIDNIMENKGLGDTSSHQALLAAVKELSGIRSSLSQAMRYERQDASPGNKIEGFIAGVGKDVDKAMHQGLDAREKQFKKLVDERTDKFMEIANKERKEIQAFRQQVQGYAQDVHQGKHAADEDAGLELFFRAAGIT